MTDSKQKQDFSERIQRIQQKHGTPPPPQVQTEAPPSEPAPKGHNLRNAMIWAILAAMAGVGGFYGLMMFDEWKLSQAAAPDNQSAPQPQPKPVQDVRQITDQGWSIPSPGLATADREQLTVLDVATGFDPAGQDAPPNVLIPFAVNSECTFKRPQPNDVVYNLRMETGTLPTTTHVFSNRAIANALIDHIEGVQVSKKHYQTGSRAQGRMFAVDVFVTDTSAPVYLVLQSFRQNVIWNLQLARGVTLSHVAMIGENSGLVAPEQDVPFEAIRISDFVTNFEFGANDDPGPCMVAPWRRPQAHWPAQAKAENGNDLYTNQIYSFNTGYRAFDAWYRQVMGVPADTNVTGPHSAAHVLVGDLPDQPIEYRSMAGRDVYVSENDFTLIGDDTFEDTHIMLLTAAVGGDLALLDPAPQEVPRQ